ncbi:MAG TPA: hypothetical protein VK465_19090 [Fibrobacteria bacterium]|nr:hypothetical protein [Fibrobacteria bacterium]
MQNSSKEYDLSLLQPDPGREAKLEKMRSKLAAFVPQAQPFPLPRGAWKRSGKSWPIYFAVVAAIVACNWLVFEKKDVLIAKVSPKAIPVLAEPSGTLTPDEQALYWTYALYDIGKLKQNFPVVGYPAIDRNLATRRIEELLPFVKPKTLGEISGYMPVAFRSVSSGGIR